MPKVTIVFKETRVYEVDVEVDPDHVHRNPDGNIYQLDCSDTYISRERYFAREVSDDRTVSAHRTEVVIVHDHLA